MKKNTIVDYDNFTLTAAIGLANLNKYLSEGKGTYLEEYPVLKKYKGSTSEFWDRLTWREKVEVGELAIHFNKMTTNYKWNCGVYGKPKIKHTPFEELKNGQKKIIEFVVKQKDKPYAAFDIMGILKLN